jgi:hypothetical protein
MKRDSFLKFKKLVWGSAGVLVLVILLLFATHSGVKPTPKAVAQPMVDIATVEQKERQTQGR